MARSSALGFHYVRHLQPGQKPAVLEVILTDSEGALTVGDCVQWTAGYLTTAATTEIILGVLIGFVTEKGENLFKTNEVHGGTLSGDDTFTASATNESVEKVKGVVIVDKDALFLNKADSSLGQAEVGTYFDTTAGTDQVTSTGSTQAQWQLIELVTDDGAGNTVNDRGLFRITESQLYNYFSA
jgi:hypothetical protein